MGFREPNIQVRAFDFNPKNVDATAVSGSFAKDFSGLFYLGEIFEGHGRALAVGTIGGTICLWDIDNEKSIAKLSGHLTAPRVFVHDK